MGEDTRDAALAQGRSWVAAARSKGMPEDTIEAKLLQAGWDAKLVQQVLADTAAVSPGPAMRGQAADGESRDPRALLDAVQRNDIESAKRELDAGASPEAQNDSGSPLMAIAAEFASPAMLALLLEKGASVNVRDKRGRFAIAYAAERDNVATLKFLLDAGVGAHSTNNDGLTSLHTAAESHALNAAKMLLDHGADVDARGHSLTGDEVTPLHVAARRGDATMVMLLVKYGADINARTGRGKTPLELSMVEGEPSDATGILRNLGAVG